MLPRTAETFNHLAIVQLFSCVGMTEGVTRSRVLKSWPEAVEHAGSKSWQDMNRNAADRFCDEILAHSKERYDKLGEVIEELKKYTVPFVRYMVEPVMRQHDLPGWFEAKVNIDIIHACLEAEYADLVKFRWFTGLSHFYAAGHFPCGWEGIYPQGRFIIY